MNDSSHRQGSLPSGEYGGTPVPRAIGDDGVEAPTYTRPVWMDIDLDTLRTNYVTLRRRLGPGIKVMPAIKANAYGHGAVPVARVLSGEGVYAFATGSFGDAVAIRKDGIS